MAQNKKPEANPDLIRAQRAIGKKTQTKQSSCHTLPILQRTNAGTSCWRPTLSLWLVELLGGWRPVNLVSMFSRERWQQHSAWCDTDVILVWHWCESNVTLRSHWCDFGVTPSQGGCHCAWGWYEDFGQRGCHNLSHCRSQVPNCLVMCKRT